MTIEQYAGNFDLALEHVASVAPSDYQIPIVAMLVVELYAQVGRIDDVARLARVMAARDANDPFTRMALMLLDVLQGRPPKARAHMTDAVVAMARADLQYSHWMAEILALMGDRDGALDWLTHAIGRGFFNYPLIATHDRLLDGLAQIRGSRRSSRTCARSGSRSRKQTVENGTLAPG
jgi:hypothetical protein